MGKKSRDKGYRLEHELVQKLQEMGFLAERVPLSGGAGGSFTGDLIVGDGRRVEVKGRASGFKQIYKWLENVDFLFIRSDRKEWLVITRLETLKEQALKE
jgi:Holliday junction resolvase